jgi:DNA polymerase-3 subunit alpha (Gram-positive type)
MLDEGNMKNKKSYELINNLSFCVFDLETTGGNHQFDKIIEIGLVRVEGFKIVDQISYLIKPELHIPEFIQKLTSIKDSDVFDAPLIEDVIDEILAFMGDSILVAHNTSFDVPFFNSVLKRLGKEEIKNKSICTNLMTKYMIPNLLSSNLNYMSKIFGLKHQKAHRALDDALASAELLLKYLNIFVDKDIQKVNNLYYPKNKFELDRINFKRDTDHELIKKKVLNLSQPFLITFKGTEGVVLYSIVSRGSDSETNFILRKIDEIDFETLTLKLVGPYIQGLIELSSYFSKIKENHQKEIIKFICDNNKLNFEKIYSKEEIQAPADFIVLNHLIPEQFVILPLQSLYQKMELVFRYPSHQNKLVQYINSKSQRMGQGKIKTDHMPLVMKNLLFLYLIEGKETLNIYRSNQKITSQDIKSILEQFVEANPNDYGFPQNFL